MDGKFFFKFLSVLLILAAIAGIAYLAFNAGVAQGVATQVAAGPGQPGTTTHPVYGWPFWFPGFPFYGFGLLGALFGISCCSWFYGRSPSYSGAPVGDIGGTCTEAGATVGRTRAACHRCFGNGMIALTIRLNPIIGRSISAECGSGKSSDPHYYLGRGSCQIRRTIWGQISP